MAYPQKEMIVIIIIEKRNAEAIVSSHCSKELTHKELVNFAAITPYTHSQRLCIHGKRERENKRG